jgi:hypothetical protein
MRKGDFKILLYHEEWLLEGGMEKQATNNAMELYNLKTDEGEQMLRQRNQRSAMKC